MKRSGILNQPLSAVIAGLGHQDMLVISDAGLPIPKEVPRIDLALVPGVPGFLETVEAIKQDVEVERLVVARESYEHSREVAEALEQCFPGVPVEQVSHTEFKRLTREAAAVVRTGECTPYANVILVAGVIF